MSNANDAQLAAHGEVREGEETVEVSERTDIIEVETRPIRGKKGQVIAKGEKTKIRKTNEKDKDTPFIFRIAHALFAKNVEEVTTYVIWDELVPRTQDFIYDMLMAALDFAFHGDSAGPVNRSRATRGRGSTDTTRYDKVSYDTGRSKYRSARPGRDVDRAERPRIETRKLPQTDKFNDVVFETRQDAVDVLTHLRDLLEVYDCVSVLDFYGAAGVSGDHTDDRYGWRNLRGCEIRPLSSGRYMIQFPPLEVLDA